MSDEQLHRDTARELGGMASDIRGIHDQFKRLNGRLDKTIERTEKNTQDIRLIQGKAIGYGAATGGGIVGLIKLIELFIK